MFDKSRPQWWQLYLLVPLMIALLVVEGKMASPLPVHRLLQFGIVLATFGLMALWVHLNQAALSNEEIEKQPWTLEPDPKSEIVLDPDMLPDERHDYIDSPLALEFDHYKGRYN